MDGEDFTSITVTTGKLFVWVENPEKKISFDLTLALKKKNEGELSKPILLDAVPFQQNGILVYPGQVAKEGKSYYLYTGLDPKQTYKINSDNFEHPISLFAFDYFNKTLSLLGLSDKHKNRGEQILVSPSLDGQLMVIVQNIHDKGTSFDLTLQSWEKGKRKNTPFTLLDAKDLDTKGLIHADTIKRRSVVYYFISNLNPDWHHGISYTSDFPVEYEHVGIPHQTASAQAHRLNSYTNISQALSRSTPYKSQNRQS